MRGFPSYGGPMVGGVRDAGGGRVPFPAPRGGQLPQQAWAALSGVWLVTPVRALAETRLVPESMKSLPAGSDGLAPPLATVAIVLTPSLAILPGYWAESAAIVPFFSSPFTYLQLPSMVRIRTFDLPAALRAWFAPSAAGSLIV